MGLSFPLKGSFTSGIQFVQVFLHPQISDGYFFFNGFLFTKLILATGVKVRIFCHFIHPSLPSPLPLVHPSMLMCVYVHKYTLFNVGILYILFMMKNTILVYHLPFSMSPNYQNYFLVIVSIACRRKQLQLSQGNKLFSVKITFVLPPLMSWIFCR